MITYAKGLYHSIEGPTWSFYKRYIAVSNGTIINIKGHVMKIKKNQNTISLKDDGDELRTIRVNRFILSSFIEDKPPVGYHADHIDEEKPNDNSLTNLQWLSVPENMIKKRTPIRERYSCIPVVRIDMYGNNHEFPSVLKASKETDISQRSIDRSCYRNQDGLCYITTDGSYWQYDISKLDQDMLENEEWIEPLKKDGSSYPDDTNIKISSMGRIMWIKPVVRIFDSVSLNTERDNAKQTRAQITLYHERRQFHELICTSFHGPSPFTGAIVRHLNDEYLDCRKDNLRWGTRKENGNDAIINNRLKKTIVTIDDIEFETMTSAAEYLNISTGYLSEICKKEKKTTFSSDFFTVDVYVCEDKIFFKREDLAKERGITISQARTLQRKGEIQIRSIKTIELKRWKQ